MKGQQPVRLSDVVPTLPEGEKLTATDKGIETLDYVNWNASKIKFINLQFNNIETLRGLGQFGNLQGIDLSNNNVSRSF
jgi:Leucine-rich repeat (LRR) protein